MKKQEESLSDKRTHWLSESKWDTSDIEDPEPIEWKGHNGYKEEDVKEAVKKLKEFKEILKTWHIELPTITLLCSEYDKFVNKIFGDKLTK